MIQAGSDPVSEDIRVVSAPPSEWRALDQETIVLDLVGDN